MIMPKLHREFPGFSICFVIGSYGGFHFKTSEYDVRICLGWVALTFYLCDIEDFTKQLIIDRQEAESDLDDYKELH